MWNFRNHFLKNSKNVDFRGQYLIYSLGFRSIFKLLIKKGCHPQGVMVFFWNCQLLNAIKRQSNDWHSIWIDLFDWVPLITSGFATFKLTHKILNFVLDEKRGTTMFFSHMESTLSSNKKVKLWFSNVTEKQSNDWHSIWFNWIPLIV